MKKVVLVVAVIVVAIVVPMIAHRIMELTEVGRETQQTLERTAEEVQKAAKQVEETGKQVEERLEPPKIEDVEWKTEATWVVISWTTTKSVPCTLKVERLGMERFSGVSRGMRHSEIVRGLLPGKEYSFTIEAGIIGTGSDSYSGTFKTERR